MSQFQLEQELQNALRLDTTINFNTSALNRSSRGGRGSNENALSPKKRAQSTTGRSSNTSLMNSSLNRSRVLGIQQPSASQNNGAVKRSSSTGRLVSPGRNGARNRTPSAGRNGTVGGDRFIPNRSTTDLESAHHSLLNSNGVQNGTTEHTDDSNLTDQQRNQLSQQTAELLNPNRESRILSFKTKAPAADEAHANSLKVLYSTGIFFPFLRLKNYM